MFFRERTEIGRYPVSHFGGRTFFLPGEQIGNKNSIKSFTLEKLSTVIESGLNGDTLGRLQMRIENECIHSQIEPRPSR